MPSSRLPSFGRKPTRMIAVALFALLPIAVANVAAMLGATSDFEAGGLQMHPDAKVVETSFAQPTAYVVPSGWVRASRTSPYALQMVVNGQPRGITLDDGQPFVQLNEGESFKVNLRNATGNSVGAEFTLDGVNVFEFRQSRKPDGTRRTRYIVAPGQTFALTGWHKSLTSVTSFMMTGFSNGAAALANSESGLGTIAVVIRASWIDGQSPPKDEPSENYAYGGGLGSAGPAVGFGDDVQQSSTIAKNRIAGLPRAIITVRYNKP